MSKLLPSTCLFSLGLFFTFSHNGSLITSPSFLKTLQCFLLFLRMLKALCDPVPPDTPAYFWTSLPPFLYEPVILALSQFLSQFYIEILLILFPVCLRPTLTSEANSSSQFIHDFLRESLPDFPQLCVLISLFTFFIHSYGCYFIVVIL